MLAFNRIGCTLSPHSSPSRGMYPRTPKLDMGGQDQGSRSPGNPLMKETVILRQPLRRLNSRLWAGDRRSTHTGVPKVRTLGSQEQSLWEEMETEDSSL